MQPRVDTNLGIQGEHAWVANNAKRRGTQPMIRRRKGEPLKPVSWADAMDFFLEKFRDARAQGDQNLACYNSGQLTIEEFYTLGKLWRGGLRSANIDGNTRLCTATSATGLMANFGTDGPIASYVDVDQADLLCLYGHNVAEVQTVLWERMLAAKKHGHGRIIVFDPRRTPTVTQGADLHVQLRVGTNVALMNGIIHLLIAHGWIDRDFIAQHTVGFGEIEVVAGEYPPERVAAICDIPREQLETAAEWIGEAGAGGTNPLVSLPDQNRTERILKRMCLVVQDPFMDTETARSGAQCRQGARVTTLA
jgi:anaerobic selenocysteine-containing dehydrogenase